MREALALGYEAWWHLSKVCPRPLFVSCMLIIYSIIFLRAARKSEGFPIRPCPLHQPLCSNGKGQTNLATNGTSSLHTGELAVAGLLTACVHKGLHARAGCFSVSCPADLKGRVESRLGRVV